MKKLLISQYKNTNFFQKLFYSKILVYSKDDNFIEFNEAIHSENKLFNINGDFITVREEHNSQNIASKISEEVINEYIKEVPNFFSDSKNYNFLYWDLRKYISVETAKLLRIVYLCQKLEKNYSLESKNIYLNPETIDIKIFNIIKKKINFTYKIDFSRLVGFYLKFFFRKILNLLCIIFLPEIKLFFCKLKSKKKKFFNVGYNIFFRQTFTNWCGSPDFFLKNQMYDKEKVIYIINSKLTDLRRRKEFKLWEKELKKKQYNFVNLASLSKFISYRDYLKKIYLNAVRMRFFFLKNFKIMQILNINTVNILDQYINWMIFFELFSIKHFTSSMIFGENISNLIQSKRSISNSFIYFSTSGCLLDNKKYPNHTEYLQFSFAKYKNFYGNRISFKQLSSWENTFLNFVETGNLTTPYILMNDKSDTLKRLKINDNKKIILFSDAAIGMNGTQSSKGFVEYLKSICKIANEDDQYHYIFKTKSSINHIYSTLGSIESKNFDDLLNNKNVYFFDDEKLDDANLQTHQLISVSEICVSTSLSSLSYDALCAKKKCIVFDPDKIYDQEQYIYTMSKLNYAQNFSELCELLNYWKNDYNSNMNERINESLIKPYLDKFCDQESIKRFISQIN